MQDVGLHAPRLAHALYLRMSGCISDATNPFDRCKPTRAMSLWQVNDLLLLLPRSELVTLNEHTDGPGDHLVGVLGCMGMAVFSRLGCVLVVWAVRDGLSGGRPLRPRVWSGRWVR